MSKKLAKASNIVLKEDIIRAELENAFEYVERERKKDMLDDEKQRNSDNDELNEQSNMMAVSALISQENDDSPINIGFGEPSTLE